MKSSFTLKPLPSRWGQAVPISSQVSFTCSYFLITAYTRCVGWVLAVSVVMIRPFGA